MYSLKHTTVVGEQAKRELLMKGDLMSLNIPLLLS
jgi:hypothetical protein